MDKKTPIIVKYKLALPIMILSGLLFVVLAWKMDANAGPDELLRIKLVNWIVSHNSLPTGFEEEIIDPIWGYSYAFTPYLPIMLGAAFAKVFSLFTTSSQVLLFACRMVNIVAGMATIFISFRIADKLLDNRSSVYYLVSLVAFLPQFVFLCGYLNNDLMNLLSAFIILDAILDGAKNKWGTRDIVYLAFGTAMCLLTYFFGYGWILFAVVCFFYTATKQGLEKRAVIRKALMVTTVVFVLAGWYFIRNAVIYDGDFLGYNAQSECIELFAAKHNISSVANPGRNTMYLRDMLYTGGWIVMTINSFIGMFGGMIICLDGKFYDFYLCAFVVPVILFILYRYKTKNKISLPVMLMLIFEIAFPIAFSIYSSYTRDFSPQGRYIITILPSLCVFAGIGIDELSKALREKFEKRGSGYSNYGSLVGALAAAAVFLVFAVIVYTVILPTLTGIYLPGADKVMFYWIR